MSTEHEHEWKSRRTQSRICVKCGRTLETTLITSLQDELRAAREALARIGLYNSDDPLVIEMRSIAKAALDALQPPAAPTGTGWHFNHAAATGHDPFSCGCKPVAAPTEGEMERRQPDGHIHDDFKMGCVAAPTTKEEPE